MDEDVAKSRQKLSQFATELRELVQYWQEFQLAPGLSPDLTRWLTRAIGQYLDDSADSLDAALGLKPPKHRSKKPPSPPYERPSLTAKQWAAAKYEDKHPNAKVVQIAKAAGVARQRIYIWREDPDYQRGRAWLRSQAALVKSQMVVERLRKRDAAKPAWPPRAKRDGLANLAVELRKNWPGSIVSMIDGRTYTDPEKYLKHISEQNVVWTGDQLDDEGKPIK